MGFGAIDVRISDANKRNILLSHEAMKAVDAAAVKLQKSANEVAGVDYAFGVSKSGNGQTKRSAAFVYARVKKDSTRPGWAEHLSNILDSLT